MEKLIDTATATPAGAEKFDEIVLELQNPSLTSAVFRETVRHVRKRMSSKDKVTVILALRLARTMIERIPQSRTESSAGPGGKKFCDVLLSTALDSKDLRIRNDASALILKCAEVFESAAGAMPYFQTIKHELIAKQASGGSMNRSISETSERPMSTQSNSTLDTLPPEETVVNSNPMDHEDNLRLYNTAKALSGQLAAGDSTSALKGQSLLDDIKKRIGELQAIQPPPENIIGGLTAAKTELESALEPFLSRQQGSAAPGGGPGLADVFTVGGGGPPQDQQFPPQQQQFPPQQQQQFPSQQQQQFPPQEQQQQFPPQQQQQFPPQQEQQQYPPQQQQQQFPPQEQQQQQFPPQQDQFQEAPSTPGGPGQYGAPQSGSYSEFDSPAGSTAEPPYPQQQQQQAPPQPQFGESEMPKQQPETAGDPFGGGGGGGDPFGGGMPAQAPAPAAAAPASDPFGGGGMAPAPAPAASDPFGGGGGFGGGMAAQAPAAAAPAPASDPFGGGGFGMGAAPAPAASDPFGGGGMPQNGGYNSSGALDSFPKDLNAGLGGGFPGPAPAPAGDPFGGGMPAQQAPPQQQFAPAPQQQAFGGGGFGGDPFGAAAAPAPPAQQYQYPAQPAPQMGGWGAPAAAAQQPAYAPQQAAQQPAYAPQQPAFGGAPAFGAAPQAAAYDPSDPFAAAEEPALAPAAPVKPQSKWHSLDMSNIPTLEQQQQAAAQAQAAAQKKDPFASFELKF